jgi:flagellar biogenesis protein FliO
MGLRDADRTKRRGARSRAVRGFVAALGVLLLACDSTAAPSTQPGSASKPAPAERRAAATAVVTAPPPPATPSATDGEAIHRKPGSAGLATTRPASTSASASTPQAFEFRRVVLALGSVIALIFGLKWVAKRVFVMPGGPKSSRTVQVLSRAALAPKQQVLLLQVGRRIVVVADSAGQMSTLCQIEDPEEVTSLVAQIMAERGMATPKSFGSVFGRTKSSFDEAMDEPIEATEPRATLVDGEPAENGVEDPTVGETRSEIRGLMHKVQRMSSQFRASRGDA